MPAKSQSKTKGTAKAEGSVFASGSGELSRRETAKLADVPLRAVDKAIEEKVVKSRRRGQATTLGWDAVVTLALLEKAELPLPRTKKRAINTWVLAHGSDWKSNPASEVPITDAVVIKMDTWIVPLVRRLESYLDGRERYLESNPEIRRGEPVIAGTRLPVHAVAERIGRGDSIDDLSDDYPNVTKKAFEAALLYAQAHPRRGRPARPWRDA